MKIRILILAILSVSLFVAARAQTDPDPNSPTPILLSTAGAQQAIAVAENSRSARQGLPRDGAASFAPNARVLLFVRNVDLMPGESASAFRVYAEDSQRRLFRFPVRALRLADATTGIYALSVELKDETGRLEAPPERGDLFVAVAWRGLVSNWARLKIGTGGRQSKLTAPTLLTALQTGAKSNTSDLSYAGYRWSGDRVRFLEQAAFGLTPALDLRVRRIGIRTWLAEQFEVEYPSPANLYPEFRLRPTIPSSDCNGQLDGGEPDPDPLCFPNHYTMYPLQNWFYKEAFYGDAQLRHRVAWALGQLWVTSGVEVQQSSHMVEYHKVLSRNAFGNWRTLMKEMTLNPAMGDYLNMRLSTKYAPNENYAREVLQLFNIGLFMLNPDGTVRVDGQGNPIPTYSQATVYNFSLLFTGWTLCEVTAQCPNRVPGAPNYLDPMILNPNNHDLNSKTLLTYPGSTTTEVPACPGCTGTAIVTYANNSLDQALDNIYQHPNVAPFVSRFLIQQLVTGDPTPAYVGRVAAVFNAHRTSTTQMKEVIRAILLDPEARGDIKTDPMYGKLREPVQLVTAVARQFDPMSADRSTISDGVLTTETNTMGQVAFLSPSVFNFFPPDYIVPGTSLNGPEFGLFTTGTAISRVNILNTLIFNRININAERWVVEGTSLGFDELGAIAAADPSGEALLDTLNIRMMHSAMSPAMRETIRNVVLTVPASNPLLRAKRAVYLVATSSQYQVQR